MAPSKRRLRARRGAAVCPIKPLTEYPTYGEQHFAEDILLAEQPVVNEPSLEMLRLHRHITLRVGPELAVHYVNAEKLFNQSTYGKGLCSRMSKIPNTRSYRVDFPDEEEQVFINLLEWINNGLYNPYKDTFRGSFLRHLKLHTLALKYGVEELAHFTIKVISDMLVESHPEQIAKAPFWSTVVNLVYSRTVVGDEMRDVVTGYTLWYLRNGRARLLEMKADTVENALLALTSLPSTSPFYRIDCTILHENPEYFKEKLNGYFGGTQNVNFNMTRWWKDFVEDPLFKAWITYWNMAGAREQTHGRPNWDSYDKDNAELIKRVDDEDETLFKSDGEKEVGLKKDGDAKVGRSRSKNKIAKAINRARDTKSKEATNAIVEIGASIDCPIVIQDGFVTSASDITPGLNSAKQITKFKYLNQRKKLEQLLINYPWWIVELESREFFTKRTERILSEAEGELVGPFASVPKDLAELGKRKLLCTKLMGDLKPMRINTELQELIRLLSRMARLMDGRAIITTWIEQMKIDRRRNILRYLKRKAESVVTVD